MTSPSDVDGVDMRLNTSERDFIRSEMVIRFGCPPVLLEGMFLRIWRSGPKAGQPRIPSAVKSMADRGLLEIRPGATCGHRAYFTEAGLASIRWLAAQPRGLDPAKYEHVWRELGLARQ